MNNTTEELFIAASRNKTRITTTRGTLAVEDLWDLSLKALDKIAVSLDEATDTEKRKSFLANPDTREEKQRKEGTNLLKIVVYVIETKQKENSEALVKRNLAKQLEFLEELKGKKELEALEGLSSEEIEKRIVELKG